MIVTIRLRYLVLTVFALFAVQAATIPIAASLAQQGATAAPPTSTPLGTAFAYQGRLEVDGVAANGTYDLRFTLHDALTAGNIIAGPLSRDDVNVANGLFTVPLDFGGAAFDGANRFLAVEAKTDAALDYELLAPRQQLTATPYALYAGNGAFWKLGGNAGTNPTTDFIGTTDATPFEVHVGGQRALRIEAVEEGETVNIIGGGGSPGSTVTDGVVAATISGGQGNTVTDNFGTVAGGSSNRAGGDGIVSGNDTRWATASGGRSNDALGAYSTIGGGDTNTASATLTSVGGGANNVASGLASTVGGGFSNDATGSHATIGGGESNTALGVADTVAGGRDNDATGGLATIGGGRFNTATAVQTTVGGGFGNDATGPSSTISGGANNTASGVAATVPGGADNTASGDYSFAAGHRAKATGSGIFVWADNINVDFTLSLPNTFNVRATGGTRIYSNSSFAGVILKPNETAWSVTSDRNMKTNFRDVDGRDILAKLEVVPIQYWTLKDVEDPPQQMGPMAQDFHAAFGLGNSDTTINTIDLDGVALAGIKGLHGIAKEQEARIAALEAKGLGMEDGGRSGTTSIAAVAGRPIIDRGAGFVLAVMIGLLALTVAVRGSYPRATTSERQ